MKYALTYALRSVLLAALLSVLLLPAARAEVRSGQVLVKSTSGDVVYSLTGRDWQPLKAGEELIRGVTIKTGADATVDLILQYNGTVLRLLPESVLGLAQLDEEQAGEEKITGTSLTLASGAVVGSQRKLAAMSHFEIKTPGGVATIKGTEYVVRADGAVSVLSGAVTERYNLPGNKGSVVVTIQAGYSFNPATGQVVPTTAAYLQNLIAHINTVKDNAQAFKVSGGATVVVKPTTPISPVTPSKGNNGVGNGVDPQPPGNPPVNYGPGTGPGNPGNKGGPSKQVN
jgi:hypothetical protein